MITLSKIVISLSILLYTILSFMVSGWKTKDERRFIYNVLFLNTIFIHIIAFAILYFNSKDYFYIIFGLVSLLLEILFRTLMILIYKKSNRMLLNHMCMLLTTGMIVLSRISNEKSIRQLIFISIAMIASILIPVIIFKVKFIRNLSLLFAIAGIAVLGYVHFLGSTTNGAKISITIANITFQPTEFIKTIFILFLSAFLAKKVTRGRLMISAVFSVFYVGLLILSRDLGSASIFAVVYIGMVYMATNKKKDLLCGTIICVAGGIAACFLFSHVAVRFSIWLKPWNDVEGKGYQIVQSLFSISSGGILGSGLLGGRPTLIPYVEADMIFSVISEELGAIFGICLIMICFHCFLIMLNISERLTQLFYRYMAYGLSVAYLFQVLLTIGGSTKYIPLTGVTLPFISYGGSSILATGIVFGIAQGLHLITMKQEREQTEYEKHDFDKTDEHEEEAVNSEDELILIPADHEEKAIKSTTPIKLTKLFFFFVFAGLIIHLMIIVTVERDDIMSNEYNQQRITKIAENNIRGTIYARDGEVLAETIIENKTEKRYYPYGELFAHVVGYMTNSEKSGIEALANYNLSITNENILQILKNDLNNHKNPAQSVVTTLDTKLQKTAHEALKGYHGAIIMMKPDTGEILVMVSSPSFDPNDMDTVLSSINSTDSSFLLNRATQGLYPPGSTFKIFTLLEYIRENRDDYQNFSFQCNGSYTYDNYKIKCYHNKAHGTQDLYDSFAYSCNSAFAKISLSLNKTRFMNLLEDVLFNNLLPISIAYEKSSILIDEDTTDAQIVQIGIGQGIALITPIHLALVTCAAANDGMLMKPYLISDIIDEKNNMISHTKAEEYKRLMTEEEACILKDMMHTTVQYGTAKSMNPDLDAAGKTGTAEYSTYTSNSHAWFTGFAPYDNPEIVVTIILEKAGSASEYAVPIANQLLLEYFEKYRLE